MWLRLQRDLLLASFQITSKRRDWFFVKTLPAKRNLRFTEEKGDQVGLIYSHIPSAHQ